LLICSERKKITVGSGTYIGAAPWRRTTSSSNAHRPAVPLAEWTNVKILERVRELQERGAARAEVTVESLIREAEEVRKEALAARQFSAAIAAVREKGVLSGKRVERSERGVPGEYADLENMSADELRAVLERELEAAGLRLVAIDAGIGAGSPGSKPN
jgi:hypothetical protein